MHFNQKHGHYRRGKKTPTYYTWYGMLLRCRDENSPSYKHYGGRGISVCKRWEEFENFLADMGARPSGLTLDRIDGNENYTKENCRWVTWKAQANNRKNNKLIKFNDEEKSISEWADHLGIKYLTLWSRLQRWPIERAFGEPVGLRGIGVK